MTHERQVQRLRLISHVTTEISENKSRGSDYLIPRVFGLLMDLIITISERVLYCFEVMSEDGEYKVRKTGRNDPDMRRVTGKADKMDGRRSLVYFRSYISIYY